MRSKDCIFETLTRFSEQGTEGSIRRRLENMVNTAICALLRNSGERLKDTVLTPQWVH